VSNKISNGVFLDGILFHVGDHLVHHIPDFHVLTRKIYGLPLGPPRWPIMGNLFHLGHKPNETLFHLATKYRPLISLTFEMKTTVVASSLSMAKEVLKPHDYILEGWRLR